MMDSLLRRLNKADELGVPYVNDRLTDDADRPAALTVHTTLREPRQCGRRPHGWAVAAGLPDSDTYAVLRDAAMLGNRSQFAQHSFRSTQTGVAPGEHGLVELRLCRGTTAADIPVRLRVEDGRFYLLSLNTDTLLAGDRTARVFTPSADTVYTLSVLMFQKAVFARLSGSNVPGGAVDLVVPDRRRFIPGRPGFGLRPNPRATGGDLAVFDWRVTPVGPAENCVLGVIGDSLTAGADGELEAESYVHLATRALGQELVLNTGSGGSNTALDLARLPYEIAPFRPQLVWIEGGSNDIGDGRTADAAFQNMRRQIELITWAGRPVLSTVPPRVLPSDAQQEELSRLNRLIMASGVPFVDRHALVRDPANPRQIRPEFRHPDGIHISKTGHALVAAAATGVLRAALSRR